MAAPSASPVASDDGTAVRPIVRLLIPIAAFILIAGCFLAIDRSDPPTCARITYTFRGSPPVHVLTEFSVAIREVHERTGLVFEEGVADGAQLVVSWAGSVMRGHAPARSSDGAGRVFAFGQGQWLTGHGGRELVRASIEVDATIPWRFGIDRADGLAAVFVHELGHSIIGLTHSADQTSFMFDHVSPRRPHWTTDDRAKLASVGRQFGCHPPRIAADKS